MKYNDNYDDDDDVKPMNLFYISMVLLTSSFS